MDACSDESVMNNAGYILVVHGEGWLRIFVLDRIGLYVHVVNGFPIFPYNSWIYKDNETFCSSANSIEMEGPLSVGLPPNSVSRWA